ncbi:MAG: hypothetical protein M3P51_16920, partial [Chloroflexota bacterium]|nr:hypothetical protein [Chloroflexota bacterium]
MSQQRLRRLVMVTSDFHYREDDHICTTSAFMRFVPELLSFSRQIEVCVPVHATGATGGYSIESDSISYRALPPSRTLEEFLRRLPWDSLRLLKGLYSSIRSADLVWINGPHPLLVMAVLVARVLRKPYLLWLRGDILEVTKAKYTGGGWRNLLALRTAQCLDRLILLAARRAVVFYTGQGL